MKAHYARYTPEMVAEITGVPTDEVPEDLRGHRLDGGARPDA